MTKVALIAGVSGIVGNNLASHLLKQGDWQVIGISRRPPVNLPGVQYLPCDLLDAQDCREKLAPLGNVTHAFFTTWVRKNTEAENCLYNTQMLRNFIDGLQHSSLRHAALVTGTKHYLGPFEAYAKVGTTSPFKETQPRHDIQNFYYELEDVLFERAATRGFNWTVARPHTIIGFAEGNVMNMGMTLAIYASICKHTGMPFVYPGSPQQYNALTDITDAELLAKHLSWSATEPKAANEAFNVVNGDVFRWRMMWQTLAKFFELEATEYPGQVNRLETMMAGKEAVWNEMVKQYKLRPHGLEYLASWWHSDADLGREVECVNDMTKSRKLGFSEYYDSEESFIRLFRHLRQEQYIP